jgi:hypothetical protein
MYDSRPEAVAGQIVVARLMGAVNRLAGWKPELTGEELDAAVRELQAITEGRPDGPALLAEAAGLLTGSRFPVPAAPGAPIRESQMLEARKSVVEAQILVAAGADEWLIDGWACIGAERAAEARRPPFGARLVGAGRPAADPARPPLCPGPVLPPRGAVGPAWRQVPVSEAIVRCHGPAGHRTSRQYRCGSPGWRVSSRPPCAASWSRAGRTAAR